VGGGKKAAVVTSGTVLLARIRRVRRKIRRVGGIRFRVRHRFIVQRRHRRRLRQGSVGAASTARLFRQRRKNVASAKANVIPRARKRSDIAKISAGAASTVTSPKSTPRNAVNAAGNVTARAKKRSGIADNCVGAASTARSCRFRWSTAKSAAVSVSARKRKPRETAPPGERHPPA